ncbi:MAG TPA: hypothetical protein VND93_22155, partial [Myxococcales bacterium]|nr:hypothetical protein [Myxococcales bacterium]
PNDNQVIYAGTGEPLAADIPGTGLFRSTNGGASFQRLAQPGAGGNGAANNYTNIVVDPNNAKRMWVAAETGLWRFDDLAATLELAPVPQPPPAPAGSPPLGITDVALAVDPTDATRKRLILLAGVHSTGVRRGVYDPAANAGAGATAWAPAPVPLRTATNNPAPPFRRVKVAFAPSDARVAYAMLANPRNIAGNTRGFPQRLYASGDAGVSFRQPAGVTNFPTDTTPPGQAFYSMVLAVHPQRPQVVVGGHVNLFVSPDGGAHWTVVNPARVGGFIDWQNFDTFATRAEHGDMHVVVFDRRDAGSLTPGIWVGNDGGVSFTNQWVAPGISLVPGVPFPPGPPPPGGVRFNWRKRSYGIQGGMAMDITSHPKFPGLTGCGFQDNSSFLSFGGPTWYLAGQGDGAALAWDPNSSVLGHLSWQFEPAQLNLGIIGPTFDTRTPCQEVAPPGGGVTNQMIAGTTGGLIVVNPPLAGTTGTGVFRTLVTGDGRTSNRLLVAAQGNAWLTTAGTSGSFRRLIPMPPNPAFTGGAGTEVGAMAFVPNDNNNDHVYVGTSTGDIYSPAAAAATWTRARPFPVLPAVPPFPVRQPWVASIAVHPQWTQVVAACAYRTNQPLMLSHNGGTGWFNASGGANPLPNCPITSVAWHPTDEKVLYVGTMVGVFVARDLPAFSAGAPAAAANPTWKTFNRGLGPLLVNDLEVVPITNTLRCATFSRGCFEASLRGQNPASYATPEDHKVKAVRLNIRDHAMDDSRTYAAAANQVTAQVPRDPRLSPAHPAGHLDGYTSIDIKVNAPEARDRTAYLQSERFGHDPDGAELDEQFVSEAAFSGDVNIVYVQVHNRGWKKAENVEVFLYAADAGVVPPPPVLVAPAPVPPAPVAPPPNLPALTGINFPDDPPAGHAWKLVQKKTVIVPPGNPRVVRFEWLCPVEYKASAALLAICRSAADDPLAAAPTGPVLAYVTAQRQAALRVLPIIPDRVFIRDGTDDIGQRGAVVWGGRSPDIIVMKKADAAGITPANADDPSASPFKNLGDARRADRLKPGDNVVFVRVSNRGAVALNAEVSLFNVPLDKVTSGKDWTPIGAPTAVNAVPPRGWRMARFEINGVPAVATPDDTTPWTKGVILAAVVRVLATANDGSEVEAVPDRNTVDAVDTFWTLFSRNPRATNAAFRALRFEP